SHMTDARYNHSATTEGLYHRDIMQLYRLGMTELFWALDPDGGRLLVKCMDEVESDVQCWSHIEVFNIATGLGLYARDKFILIPDSPTCFNRWKTQRHARKTHSYLWVFEKIQWSPRSRKRCAPSHRLSPKACEVQVRKDSAPRPTHGHGPTGEPGVHQEDADQRPAENHEAP